MNNQNKTVGVKVISTTSGKIPKVDGINRINSDGRGKYIRIEGEDGSRIDYMHMNSINSSLKKGDPVIAGVTVLGEAGTTGTNGAHLHIAKSFVNSEIGKKHGYDSKGVYGEDIKENQYIHYIAIGSKEDTESRVYVIPPEPITPSDQE